MPKNEKRYRVIDPEDADRIYTVAVHGFDFSAKKGEVEEVDENLMKLLKKASPFLSFELIGAKKPEKKVEEEPTLGSRRDYRIRRRK